MKNILKDGLNPMGRRYVHLSETLDGEVAVGKRRLKAPIILKINREKGWDDDIEFKKSRSICLTKRISPEYIIISG